MATVAAFTDTGRAALTAVLTTHGPGWMGFGKNTGSVAASHADTALNAELTNGDTTPGTYARPTTTITQAMTNVTDDTMQATGTFTQPSSASSPVTVAECGLFDAVSGPNLWARATFSGILLSQGFGLAPVMSLVFG